VPSASRTVEASYDELAEEMGPVSRFEFEADDTVYVAGDTIWYEPAAETLAQFDPEMVVLNGGEARFEQGEPITMGTDDIAAVREATDATVAVVHMEAIISRCGHSIRSLERRGN
jgi:hypothetical protein